MKKMIGKVVDKGRELVQILILIACFTFPKLVNLSEIIRTLFGGQSPDFSNAKYYYLMKLGNWTIGIILAIIVLFKYIRKSNNEKALCNGNVYHDYSYCWFFFCSKVLGYKSCNLVLIPIAMQYKLVIRGTFESYYFPEGSFQEQDLRAIVEKDNDNKENCNELNIVLEDTYPIIKEQLPESKRSLPIIKVKHDRENDVSRIFNKKFVKAICNVVRGLPDNTIVNVYATTNPKHNYEIARQVFSLANRGNITGIYIYQQERSKERKFSTRKKIYRFLEE